MVLRILWNLPRACIRRSEVWAGNTEGCAATEFYMKSVHIFSTDVMLLLPCTLACLKDKLYLCFEFRVFQPSGLWCKNGEASAVLLGRFVLYAVQLLSGGNFVVITYRHLSGFEIFCHCVIREYPLQAWTMWKIYKNMRLEMVCTAQCTLQCPVIWTCSLHRIEQE